ncbi:hypothetical protein [Elizabethkingia meningoseptica]|uniref:hypothetical protein n=1 Tax=Elizabethkingia meningoseptica TaxID=238 RepID=UPI001625B598|nr:hypothetical protein [Elizabethkingia meningoseptica]HAY3553717.1 hypothetical protein [Elizabethkingia meningoseptica]
MKEFYSKFINKNDVSPLVNAPYLKELDKDVDFYIVFKKEAIEDDVDPSNGIEDVLATIPTFTHILFRYITNPSYTKTLVDSQIDFLQRTKLSLISRSYNEL